MRKTKEENNIYNRGYTHRNPEKILFLNVKSRAKKKGWDFNLEPSDIVIPSVCPVLGIPIYVRGDPRRLSRDSVPSIDRIDNTKGYVKGNVEIISGKANRLKSSMDIGELLAIVAYIARKRGTKSNWQLWETVFGPADKREIIQENK